MRMSPWAQPFFNDLHREMNRWFHRHPNNGASAFDVERFPAFNIREDENAYFLEADLPGVELNDLEIFITAGNQLTVKGERKAPAFEKSVQHRQERGFGKFTRVVTLPTAVDDAQVEAKLEHGALSLRLPKHENALPRKIAIKS